MAMVKQFQFFSPYQCPKLEMCFIHRCTLYTGLYGTCFLCSHLAFFVSTWLSGPLGFWCLTAILLAPLSSVSCFCCPIVSVASLPLRKILLRSKCQATNFFLALILQGLLVERQFATTFVFVNEFIKKTLKWIAS